MQIRAGLYVKLHVNAWNNRECKQRHAKALLTQEEPTLEYYDNKNALYFIPHVRSFFNSETEASYKIFHFFTNLQETS